MKSKIIILLVTCLFVAMPASAQRKNKKVVVTGYVLDNNGSPLEGILLFVDKVKSSKVTGRDGSFKLKIKPSTELISAFSVTNGLQEIPYAGQTEITFVLNASIEAGGPEIISNDELVDMGYGKKRKDEVTTSVGSVDFNKGDKANYSNIYDMIRGEVPGVTVSGNSILIRGVSSIRGNNQPLFIVNGSPVTSIDNISPHDVESIDILKGAATAIYGSRGTNGVIVINLKKSNK